MPQRGILVLPIACLVALVVGCSGSDKWSKERPKTVPASGTVTYKGAPVEGATVVFVPDGGKHAAAALTDSSGQFDASAFSPQSGAVPGKYRVTVTKLQPGPRISPDEHDIPPGKQVGPIHLLPRKYSETNTTDLRVEIPDGGKTDITFDLKD